MRSEHKLIDINCSILNVIDFDDNQDVEFKWHTDLQIVKFTSCDSFSVGSIWHVQNMY